MPFDADSVAEQLPGRTILWLEQTDSTMLDAARLADAGCPSGTVVGADLQTAGQGRQGHSWYSEKESGLYFSLVLRLSLPAGHLPILTMALGLAAAETVAQHCGVAVDLRWPNDVLAGGKKVCGILVQQARNALICGVGLNANQQLFPPDLAPIATSLRIAAGRAFSREALFINLLSSIDRHAAILVEQGKQAVLDLFTQASTYVRGRRVMVDQGGEPLHGITEGMDADGFLILRRDDGSRTLILAGGVRPV
ncbi:MAG: biotin--[acetyl-CoA-carboxylase] ligase [Bryobacterales bacterium]|nr:biotin--[acetyl-CoA-carboxylase] ligase [Bryobacterales bacterium]